MKKEHKEEIEDCVHTDKPHRFHNRLPTSSELDYIDISEWENAGKPHEWIFQDQVGKFVCYVDFGYGSLVLFERDELIDYSSGVYTPIIGNERAVVWCPGDLDTARIYTRKEEG